MHQQLILPLGPIRNSNFLSNHWLEHRLPLESEWGELRDQAIGILRSLADLWAQQHHRVEQYSEPGLEQAFIQPIMQVLGWKLNYQTFLRGGKPDYALFLDDPSYDAALAAGRNSIDFWKFPALVADAKAWAVNLDRPSVVKNQREFPPEQIERYLTHSNLDYAILTNGRQWRLYPRSLSAHQPRFETYLGCDLAGLLTRWTAAAAPKGQSTFVFSHEQAILIDDFLRFFLFFSPVAFRPVPDRARLIERAISGSSEYRVGVGEGLKGRVFRGLELCIEGFLNHQPNGLNALVDMAAVKEQSLILLYRLLFIMYAEDRNLLPLRTNPLYRTNRCLSRLRDEIAGRLDDIDDGRGVAYDPGCCDLWADIGSLFDLIDKGGKRYGVPAYNGGLFDPDENLFLAGKQLPDPYLARVIDQLSRAPDTEHPEAGLFRVDYRDLAIQHLGHIYEGLLELQPNHATEQMIVVRQAGRQRTEERAIPVSAPVPAGFEQTETTYTPGQVFLLTDKGERRASGSYYTPNPIVDRIVERTLGPLCRQIDQQLTGEIETTKAEIARTRGANRESLQRRLAELEVDFGNRVLRLRVIDIAMGSGHFLLRGCQYLAEEIATNPHASAPPADQLADEESVLTYWKRRIVEHCLYGVDLNPMAVELAKVALWLETASVNQPLTFLDHHLRHGNSLVGGWVENLGALRLGHAMPLFQQKVNALLPVFLQSLGQIDAIPSDTAEQVKQKTRIYRDSFDKIREPFLRAADLWCSTFFVPPDQQVEPDQYDAALQTLDNPAAFRKLAKEPWFQSAVAIARRSDVACFHWELEFPEAFFDLSGRRAEGGFDAVIGNPPYDVLSDRETGRDLSALRKFLQAQPIYDSSFRHKNNLYKLFVCLGLALVRDGGRMGFITPMAILGDDQAADLRRQILDQAAFTSVDAFPQKDEPDRRVFREAKLSTAVFTFVKSADATVKAQSFVARVHPADRIEESSPSLKLTTASIPLYDPANVTVVSCSQEDWDLAVRIMGSGRMVRLKDYAEFFQGEVNETNERARGNLLTNGKGQLVTRGACICLYVPRPASQGTDLHLDVLRFLKDKGPDTKAFHHEHRRIGLQESCPQNNFRRIIASLIPAGEFCNHKVNCLPEHTSKLPLEFSLALLNSKLADWYFRLGSTNAAVSHYQLYNLPCPQFGDKLDKTGKTMLAAATAAVGTGQLEQAFDALRPGLIGAPFSPAVRDAIVELVNRIIQAEQARGEIARSDRSALCPEAQPYQDLIDRLFYAMAGLTDQEARGLEDRLARML